MLRPCGSKLETTDTLAGLGGRGWLWSEGPFFHFPSLRVQSLHGHVKRIRTHLQFSVAMGISYPKHLRYQSGAELTSGTRPTPGTKNWGQGDPGGGSLGVLGTTIFFLSGTFL